MSGRTIWRASNRASAAAADAASFEAFLPPQHTLLKPLRRLRLGRNVSCSETDDRELRPDRCDGVRGGLWGGAGRVEDVGSSVMIKLALVFPKFQITICIPNNKARRLGDPEILQQKELELL